MNSKKKRKVTPLEREKLLREHASRRNHEQGTVGLMGCWAALIYLWEAFASIRTSQDTLWVETHKIMLLVEKFHKQMQLTIPAEVLRTVEVFRDEQET